MKCNALTFYVQLRYEGILAINFFGQEIRLAMIKDLESQIF